MAFKYKFQSILDLKTRIEDQKKSKYGEANAELNRQQEKLDVLFDERTYQIELMREKGKNGVTPKELIVYNNYMERLKRSIEIQKVVVDRAKKAAEQARLELVEAAKQRKMFETLKEKQMEEYWEDYYRKEQAQLDEIVSYKYNGGVKDG